MTNYEKIMSMSVEEMADYIFDLGNGGEYCFGYCAYQYDDKYPQDDGKGCIGGVIKYLKSEVEE